LRDFPGISLVTADDDIIYPAHWLQDLVNLHKRWPRAVIAHRCLGISVASGKLQPYHTWRPATTQTPADAIFPTTGGGVLCPPEVMPPVTLNEDLAVRLAPSADDVWFRAAAWLGNLDVKLVRDEFPVIVTPPAPLRIMPLSRINVTENDRQLAAVLSYFGLWSRIGAVDPGSAG
jgi:hypothetical protein